MDEPMTAARLDAIDAMYTGLPEGKHRDKRLAQTVPELAAEVRRLRAVIHEQPPAAPESLRIEPDLIAEAIGDPGSVTDRETVDGTPESVTRWASRAVAMVLPTAILGRMHYLERSNREHASAVQAVMHAHKQLAEFHDKELTEAAAVIDAQADALADFPQHEDTAAEGRAHAVRIRGLVAIRAMWDETP